MAISIPDFLSDTAKGFEMIRLAISLSEQIGDKKRICKSYIKLALYYDHLGKLKEGFAALSKIEDIVNELNDLNIEASYYYKKALLYYYEGTYIEAINNLWIAHDKFQILQDTSFIGNCYLTIGTSYLQLEDIDNALHFYIKAKQNYNLLQNEKLEALAIGNIGLIYREKKDYNKALDYYNQSLNINKKHNNIVNILVDLNNICDAYIHLGEYNKAITNINQMNILGDSIGDRQSLLLAKHNLGVVKEKQGKYNDAILLFHEVLNEALELNYKEDIKDACESLSNNYAKIGNYKEALNFRNKFEAVKDSIINADYLKQISEMELKYETAEKDRQILKLAAESKIQKMETLRQSNIKNIYILGFGLMTLFALFIYYTYKQRLKTQKLLAHKNAVIQETQFKVQMALLELKALRAQINPHFLFNCMNSINRMIQSNENEQASSYLAKFSMLVRLILENSETPYITLKNELILLESYIQMEELRFKGKINYQIDMDKNIDTEDVQIPSMIIQPFIENAIWHGLVHKAPSEKGLVSLSFFRNNANINCIIEDNGVGRKKARELSQNSMYKSKSLGIQITNERLKLISMDKVEKYIHFEDLKDQNNQPLGTKVEITIPVK